MTIHECIRCDYKTKNVVDFRKHLQRKILCEAIKGDVSLDDLKKKYLSPKMIVLNCPKCAKGFSSTHGYKSHIEKCTASNPQATNTSDVLTRNDIKMIKDEIISEITDKVTLRVMLQVKDMLTKIVAEAGQSTVINNNITDNHIDNRVDTINIVVNRFGGEKIDHLLEDVDFMKSCFEKHENGLIDFMLRKWFDSDHPENHSIQKVSNNVVKVLENTEWKTSPVSEKLMDSVINYVGYDYQSFLERHPVFEKKFLDKFMKCIGVPLLWDLDHGDYISDIECEDKDKMIRDKIYKMLKNEVFNTAHP